MSWLAKRRRAAALSSSVTTHLRTTLASTTTFIAFLREAFQVFRSRAPHRPDLFHRTNPGSRQFSPFQSFQLPERPFARSTPPVAGIGGSKELPDLLLHRYPVVSGPPLDRGDDGIAQVTDGNSAQGFPPMLATLASRHDTDNRSTADLA